jgi:hypothetical protein
LATPLKGAGAGSPWRRLGRRRLLQRLRRGRAT